MDCPTCNKPMSIATQLRVSRLLPDGDYDTKGIEAERREAADLIEELEAVLKEAEVCLTTTFRDMGVRHDACVRAVRAALGVNGQSESGK